MKRTNHSRLAARLLMLCMALTVMALPCLFVTEAQAAAVTYTISFDPNGGTGTMDSITAEDGKECVLPANRFMAPSGKHFLGWAYTPTGQILPTSYLFTTDTKLYAVWENILDPTAPKLPSITSPISDQTVTAFEGEPVVMEITAENAVWYQWYVNRNDGNGYSKIDGENGTSYTIASVALENDGYMYYCMVYDNVPATFSLSRAADGGYRSPIFTLRVSKAVEEVPQTSDTGNTEIPQTGDKGSPALWFALFVASGSAALALIAREKRRAAK
ncbi:MAG: InlB B-repeat-containing protein [Clostridiales bacterium]|nr:InlB B-repeat-containing protein [Clostridiales bacterium]